MGWAISRKKPDAQLKLMKAQIKEIDRLCGCACTQRLEVGALGAQCLGICGGHS